MGEPLALLGAVGPGAALLVERPEDVARPGVRPGVRPVVATRADVRLGASEVLGAAVAPQLVVVVVVAAPGLLPAAATSVSACAQQMACEQSKVTVVY